VPHQQIVSCLSDFEEVFSEGKPIEGRIGVFLCSNQ